MKVLVTGANGFLATNVIVELLTKNYSVVGLLRDVNKFQYHHHPNLRLVEGDITSPGLFESAVKDCNFIIHIAAITEQNLPHYHQYKKVNVEATELLLDLALKYGVKKIIYVSTANTLGFGTKNKPGNEKMEIRYPFTKSNYALSKLRGQHIAFSYQDKLDVVVVNPTFMLGRYDSKPSSGQIIMMGYNKKFIFYPPGGKNFVHVKDVASGIINALENGRNGESYLLANENLSYLEFFRKLSDITHHKPVYVRIPVIILVFVGFIGSLMRFFGIKTNLSLTNMQAICINNYFDNKKAQEQLGLSFQSIENAIDDALDWFKQKKMIK